MKASHRSSRQGKLSIHQAIFYSKLIYFTVVMDYCLFMTQEMYQIK